MHHTGLNVFVYASSHGSMGMVVIRSNHYERLEPQMLHNPCVMYHEGHVRT